MTCKRQNNSGAPFGRFTQCLEFFVMLAYNFIVTSYHSYVLGICQVGQSPRECELWQLDSSSSKVSDVLLKVMTILPILLYYFSPTCLSIV